MKTKKILSFAFFIVLVFCSLILIKLVQNKDTKDIKINLNKDEIAYIESIKDKPISFMYNSNLRYEYSKPLLDLLENELGLNIVAKRKDNWEELFNGVANEEYDLLAGVTPTKERESLLYFSEAVASEYRIGVTSVNNPVMDVNEIANKKVGFIKGTLYYEYSKFSLKDNEKIFYYENNNKAIEALTKGEIDIFISGDSVKEFIVENENIQIEFVFQDRPADKSVVTAKEEMKPLIDIINKFLEDKDGKLREEITKTSDSVMINKMREYLKKNYPVDSIGYDKINVIAQSKYFPFSYEENKEIKGSDIEVLNLFKEITGVDYNIDSIDSQEKDELLKKLNDNEYQLLIGNSIISKDDNLNKVKHSTSLKSTFNIISVTNTLSDIEFVGNYNLKIGIISEVVNFVRQSLATDGYVEYKTSDDAITALKSREVDVILLPRAIFDYERNVNKDISIIQNSFISIPYAHDFLLNRDNELLNDLIEETIRFYLILNPITNNKDWINRVNEYQGSYYKLQYSQQIKNNILLTSLFIAFILFILILIWRNKAKTNSILERSKSDKLTGLYNVNSYKEQCENLISKYEDTYGAFVFIDLDNFKKINDSYGHIFGDEYLKVFSDRLKTLEDDKSIAFRIAGDEFGFFSIGYESYEEIEEIIKGINKREPIRIKLPDDNGTTIIKYSLGYSIYNLHAKKLGELKEYADFAMYKAKNRKNNNVNIARFNIKEYMDEKEKQRKYMEIETIINKNQLYTEYQEIVDIKNNCTYGYEGLTRIAGNDEFSIGDLIKVSYKLNYTEKLDILMVKNTMSSFNSNKRIFVNIEAISKKVVVKQSFNIMNMASFFKIPFENIVIEIREKDELSIECMDEILKIRETFGFSIAIDDFGTGYSNFSMLFYLKPDILKIHMSLIRDIDKDNFKASYIKSIIAFLKEENIKILCEGIETKEEYQILKEIGADLGQGYYIGYPHKLERIATS